MAPTTDQVLDALTPVHDPLLRRSIVELDMVRDVQVDDGRVRLQLVLAVPEHPERAELAHHVEQALGGLATSVDLSFTDMSDEERAALRLRLHGSTEERSIPFSDPASKTRVLLIASGKGGVGKSSVTTNLAVALAQRDHRVSVVDADVWGFSIPRMLGVERPPVTVDQMIVPPEANGVTVISMGFFAREDQPVIWRGPMLHKALEQFLTDVWWDEPGFLVVDLPPGTGDISISLAQFLPHAQVFIVTTPQPAAQRVAQRAAFMARKVNLDVKGVIENMSWFTGDDGKRYEIFGSGGGQELSDDLDVPLVGQVPLVPALRQGADEGRPIVVTDPQGEAALAFAEIARRIDEELGPTRRFHPELKII